MEFSTLHGTKETTSLPGQIAMDALGILQKVTDQAATLKEITRDLAFMKILMVNICFFGIPDAEASQWVLIDTGLPDSSDSILLAAQRRFGFNNPPTAIILTHGHFDHVGSVVDLIKKWDVPVYAHKFEIPFLTGKLDYFMPDPSVDDGLMTKISTLYPYQSINLGNSIQALPSNGEVPGMQGWRWIATPGHTPGHISLFRDTDRLLIAGDAFTTTEQESAIAVINQTKEIHGPPKYFTSEWQQAWESVKRLESLNPSLAITGHGLPMGGKQLARQLKELATNFNTIAIPPEGRYVP